MPESDMEADPARVALALVERFNEAFNRHDVDALMALMTKDCVFENTYPAPDGARHRGQQAVRQTFDDFFGTSPQARIDAEKIISMGDYVVVLWIYHWVDPVDGPGHVRGIDLFQIREHKIAEKLSYVKG
jgi:uncharacterized protein (TIGR02246 family)